VVVYGPFSLCVIHKEGLCPSSEDINMLMMSSDRSSLGDPHTHPTIGDTVIKEEGYMYIKYIISEETHKY
jgi:hypothetical protein